MKLFFSIFFCFVFLEAMAASSEPSAESQSAAQKIQFSEISRKNVERLKKISKSDFDQLISSINKAYPDGFLVGSCKGKLKALTEEGYGLALVRPYSKSAIYVAASKDKNKMFVFQELIFFDITFSQSGDIIGRGIEVSCESWTDLRKIDENYRKQVPGSTRGSSLRPQIHLDSICGTSNEGDMEFLCFQYDPGKGRFAEIGGWHND
ncbi:hypothetical protein MJ904_05020 [Massilia sp. MB5]|uniref:hypothetical protein n=1 Tax=Massilia sp. MB5 TaxID=2919578 RepID=UPI001F113BF8|nr:hypothetical protein [Massilia sp. MB5]UMR31582.1 hypothetical protein MJ904_05020 [Massilia sp. MB5]